MKNSDIIQTIYKLNSIIQSHLATVLKEYQVSYLETMLLSSIKNNPGLNQEQLAFEIGISKNVLAQKIARLNEVGLISRLEDKGDRRNKKLYLTSSGESLLTKISTEITKYNKTLINDVSDFNLKTFEKTLKKAISNVKKNK